MRSKLAAALCLALVGLGSPEGAIADAPPEGQRDAAGVTALVQAFYDQTRTVQADFKQTRYTRVYDRYDRAEGKVVFKRPGKMRWDYAAPNGQVFVTDGAALLLYQPPDEGEKNGQLIERSLDDDQLPAAFSFLTGVGNLEEDFDARLLEAGKQGFKGGYALQLLPKKPTPHYEQLVFFVRLVDVGGKQAGVVQRVLIIDASGNRNRFDFANMKFNRDVPDKRFSYSAPKGTVHVKP